MNGILDSKIGIMKKSNISRETKQNAIKDDVETLHRLWTVRIQELIRDTGKDAHACYKLLCDEVAKTATEYPPQTRLQFTDAWRAYQRRVENVCKH